MTPLFSLGASMKAFKLLGLIVLLVAGSWFIAENCFGPSDTAHQQWRQERRAADSLVRVTIEENQRLRADSAAAEERILAANEREASYKASADQKAVLIARLLQRSYRPAPSNQTPPGDPPSDIALPPMLDSAALAATCEERYGLRTAEALDLRLALGECGHAKRYERERYAATALALTQTTQALVSSDSARLVEIARPRPCRRDLLIWSPSCTTVDLLVLGLGVTGGIVLSR